MVALLAATLVTFSPLQLQQSHYCTVDVMLLFFIMLTLLGCVMLVDARAPLCIALLIGIGYGLALAVKSSAAPLAIPVLMAALLRWWRERNRVALFALGVAAISTCVTFVLVMPYALLDWHNFFSQVAEQGNMSLGKFIMPYTLQFSYTTPYLYELQNIFLWGLGPLLTLSAGASLLWLGWRVGKRQAGPWLIVLSWLLIYGGITGSFYVKFVRYMLPLYPALIVAAAAGLTAFAVSGKVRVFYVRTYPVRLTYVLSTLVLLATSFQGLAMVNIYSQPNTLIQASQWMFDHLKPGSTIAYEQQDAIIPVAVNGRDAGQVFHLAEPGLNMSDYDNPEKLQFLAEALASSDVIVLSSDRWDQPVFHLPQYYPITGHYYHLLFQGQLGFHLAAQFEDYPHLLGITLNDSASDPSFSIFDHPIVRIFVRDSSQRYSAARLLKKMLVGAPPMPGLPRLP
ncbi:phospholipid carrier-dependent glycosyltransferase [Dictyobacter kobayashii]|uniref:ArnT-like N-terminal domain-containing protein n=1 Tax=Dictyobacter kobayashii TaxID=2014872 RepID=A0A402AHK9_9CHLR|nr:phospholipid carrier-dependent glycosyltransferase [Dictyobacter kobayashii]GCE18543.1 hypothetical protein KDK_23430 [Dictyobacter kobayashii]